jgi:hypothetical protein
MGNAIGIAGIAQVPPDQPGQSETVGQIAKQQRARIGTQTFRAGFDRNRTVEIRRKECTCEPESCVDS